MYSYLRIFTKLRFRNKSKDCNRIVRYLSLVINKHIHTKSKCKSYDSLNNSIHIHTLHTYMHHFGHAPSFSLEFKDVRRINCRDFLDEGVYATIAGLLIFGWLVMVGTFFYLMMIIIGLLR